LAHPEPGFDVNYATQSPDTDKAFFVAPTKVSFLPFRRFRRSSFCGRRQAHATRGRALEILITLLERRGELVSKQDLMALVWRKVFVEAAKPLGP
jgi:DNA-binding response OmpR family regulator